MFAVAFLIFSSGKPCQRQHPAVTEGRRGVVAENGGSGRGRDAIYVTETCVFWGILETFQGAPRFGLHHRKSMKL